MTAPVPPAALVVEGGVTCLGTVRTPGEKSISHRSVLLAALAEGTSVVHGLSDGADVAASLAAVEAMGVARRAATRRRAWCSTGAAAACTRPSIPWTAATRAPPCASWPASSPACPGPPS